MTLPARTWLTPLQGRIPKCVLPAATVRYNQALARTVGTTRPRAIRIDGRFFRSIHQACTKLDTSRWTINAWLASGKAELCNQES